LAIVLGSVLDGIPESFVLGLTILQGGVSLSLLAGVALSNLCAARTSSQLNQSMRRAGHGRSMLAFRSVVSVLLRALGDFSLHPQGRPAGGRLRRPSSAANPDLRVGLGCASLTI
jgi:ZIP family zinc transporter